ncbi:MAG: hypothetical protein JWO35_507 [Candidatus Saccharibacteria bacterium]|nr:hypothetical protein [Candidatus Saccharibacteria bacterium]
MNWGRYGRGLLVLAYLLVVCVINFYNPGKARADSIIYVSAATSSGVGNITSITVTKPTGVVSGDVMIAAVGSASTAAIASTDVSNPWTVVTSTSYGGGSTSSMVVSLVRVAGASEPASYDFAVASGSSHMAAGIAVYRGVSNSNPIDATGSSNTGTSTAPATSSITTATAQTKVIGIYGSTAVNPQTYTPPTSPATTERIDVGSTNAGGQNPSLELTDYHLSTAGSFNPNASALAGSADWGTHQLALKPDGVQHMMLFWDGGGSAPTGWSFVTEAEGRFVRGESPANYGTVGGDATRPFTPTSTVSLGAPSNTVDSGGNGGNTSLATHTHSSPAITVGSDSNGDLPAYRNLRLIRYDAGIPNIIPNGAIALFSSAPGSPNLTRYSSQDNAMVRIASTAGGTGGADSVTNTICGNASSPCTAGITLGAASGAGQVNSFLGGGTNTASATHTHSISQGTATSSTPTGAAGNGDPPYTQPLMYKATADSATLSLNLTAMFDSDPGSGWSMLSDSAGKNYYQAFIRPNGIPSAIGPQVGQVSHTNSYTVTTTAATPNGTSTFNLGVGNQLAGAAHTHSATVTLASQSNIPPYFNVVVAQKVNFKLTHYQWYVESGVEAVTNRWPSTGVDVGQDAQIPATPGAYLPPDDGDSLRIRMQLTVNGPTLVVNTVSFKLQYSVGTTGSDCTSGTWQDVNSNASTTRPWRYGSNGVTDGSQLITNTYPSTHLENFYRSSSTGAGFTNPDGASTGDTLEYDWLIQDYQATGATQYNFRAVENKGIADSGTLLSVYSTCPSVVTRPTTDQVMRHGEFFMNGGDQGFLWAD